MQPGDSLPHSHAHATCPYPESDRSSPCPSSHFLKTHLNIILPSTPAFSKCFFPSRFPPRTLYTLLLSPILATCPANLILPDFNTRIILGEEYRPLSSSLCSFLYSFVNTSLLGTNIPLNTLFSITPSLRSSLNVSDRVSHPYKTKGKIRVLYILIFLDNKLEDKRFCAE